MAEEKFEELKKLQHVRDQVIREEWIGMMEARLVRNKLQQCWRTEGVNHYQTCADLSQRYLTLLRENKIEGHRKLDFSS